ncbi:MAG: helix-turn-helix transcriptional regulator [Anaerolineales bacterium]|nr:helix-turn-helix transcriptional regulator [Anaerolineales bacterium]
MPKADDVRKYLPLTESMFYVMLSLLEPLHGYGVMQKAEALSRGTVTVGPGTLYGMLTGFEEEGLITLVKEEERRKSYLLSAKGKRVLARQIERLEIMNKCAGEFKNRL